MNKCVTILELFGGIGAPRSALIHLKQEFKVLDYIEVDKTAVDAYNLLYGEKYTPSDIRTWRRKELKDKVDICVHGSPCQDFSIAGNQAGGNKGSGTRSSLMWCTVNIVKNILPKVVIWENVKNVLSKRHTQTTQKYIKTLESYGYHSRIFVLNSKDFGECQNRVRVIVISTLNNKDIPDIMGDGLIRPLNRIIEETVSDRYYIPKEHFDWFCRHNEVSEGPECMSLVQVGSLNKYGSPYLRECRARVYSTQGISPTLTTFVPVLIYTDEGIRRLTPKETLRVQGFTKNQYERLRGLKEKDLYRLAGNSMSVRMMKAVMRVAIELL